MFEVVIRNMQVEDIEQVMAIESKSFGTHHWSANSFESEINSELGNYFVAIDAKSNNLLGYCGFWLIQEEAHITTIAVDPNLRKSGIGELLVQKMIDTGYEQNAKWFTLEVRAGNVPAIGLYKKYGFDSLGVRKKYYQDNNEDALIMWTENIWHSKYKELYTRLKEEFKAKKLASLVG